MRAAAVVALLLHALPGAYGVAATTFVRVPEDRLRPLTPPSAAFVVVWLSKHLWLFISRN